MSVREIKKYLINQFGLPEDQVALMIPDLLSALSEHLQHLKEAYAEDDNEKLERYAHTIKGACLSIGLKECAAVAAEIEISCRGEAPPIDLSAQIDLLDHRIPHSL